MEINLDEPTRPQLAALFGKSSRWIGELRSKGELPDDGASWAENLEMWIDRHLPEQGGAADGLDLDRERARLAKEQADSKEMDNAERRGELVSRPDITLAFASVIALAVSRLQLVPDVVAKGDSKLRQRIETAMNDALEELSMARVEESMGGGVDEEDDLEAPEGLGNTAAPEADPGPKRRSRRSGS
ncbi:terminase [Sphingomonas sp. OTU376]|uniref:terminase n=1 Tax=Sphingomonas sp. OTU376 TaxID=3043863 RepID=UPI00313BEE8E